MFTGIVRIKLSSPVKWEDREISVVELDFGKVTSGIINQIEKDVVAGGNIVVLRHMSSDYCGRLAAAISGLPFRVIEKLPYHDSEPIWQTVSQYVNHKNPQKFYDQFLESSNEEEDEKGFTEPVKKPAETAEEKPEEKKMK